MKFYELPPAVNSAIRNTDIRPYVRVLLELSSGDVFIPDSDILSCVISSYKSSDGGIINKGEIVLNNTKNIYNVENNSEYTTDLGIQIWYCFSDSDNTFCRFHLFADDSGFQVEETGFLEKTTTIKLVDLSNKLDSKKLQMDWSSKKTIVHSVVCDKNNIEKSLVHIIAERAGLDHSQINCGYLPFNIPYVVLENSVWQELCALARAYNATVECGRDLSLSFIESPYDSENTYSEESCFTLTEEEITHYRFFNENENYANSIRLKYTRYVETKRQELWRYSDSPTWYDESMRAYYPFSDDSRSIIKDIDYQAIYTAKNEEGKYRDVVYAEDLDTSEEFLNAMETTDDKKLSIVQFDTASYRDRAIIQLSRDDQLVGLYKAAINGKAIISETNFSVFLKNDDEIAKHGQIIKNVTSKFLSDDRINEVPFYEKRAGDLLSECIKSSAGYYLTTYIPMIHARVGACLDIRLRPEGNYKKVRIDELTFRYKKEEAFSTEIWVKNT